jgi:hypothetical protein
MRRVGNRHLPPTPVPSVMCLDKDIYSFSTQCYVWTTIAILIRTFHWVAFTYSELEISAVAEDIHFKRHNASID